MISACAFISYQDNIKCIHKFSDMQFRQIDALYKQMKPYWFVSALICWFMTKSNQIIGHELDDQ